MKSPEQIEAENTAWADDLGLTKEEGRMLNDLVDGKQKPMFEDEAAGEETINGWKDLLVLANTHQRRTEDLKKLIGGELTARVKHYRKVSAALADAIRFKSTLELERHFGPEFRDVLAEIKPLDGYLQSLQLWVDDGMQRPEDGE